MKRYILFFFLIIIFLMSTGCSGINQNKIRTDKEIIDESRFLEMIEKGDKEFVKMHWVGWRNSILAYKEALELKDSIKVREKLFFSYLHRAIRARFFFLPGLRDLKEAEKLMHVLNGKSRNIDLYYKVAKRILFPGKQFNFSEEEVARLMSSVDSDYKYFFYILFQSRKGGLKDYRDGVKEMIKLFPDSNFRYLLRDVFIEIDKGIRGNPEFIELILRRGDRFFNTGKLRKAEEYYQKVLAHDANIPFALTGLGNIYLNFDLYMRALYYFNSADRIAPLYYKTLFGKAVCLSQLGDHWRSIEVLNKMIENALPYVGEVFYYRAFNYFLMKKYSKVEPDLINSKEYIPDSVELNTLFGMFYYETKRDEESRIYFNKVLKINKKYPRPYYYLGFLDLRRSDTKNALKKFSMAGKFYLEMIKRSLKEISRLKDQDLSKDRLEEVRVKRKKRVRSKIKEIINKLNVVIKMFKGLKRSRIEFLYQTIEHLNILLQSDPFPLP